MVAMFLHQTKLIISMNLITALIKINKPSHLYVYYKYWLFPHLFWGFKAKPNITNKLLTLIFPYSKQDRLGVLEDRRLLLISFLCLRTKIQSNNKKITHINVFFILKSTDNCIKINPVHKTFTKTLAFTCSCQARGGRISA